jgi:hypothetical protein
VLAHDVRGPGSGEDDQPPRGRIRGDGLEEGSKALDDQLIGIDGRLRGHDLGQQCQRPLLLAPKQCHQKLASVREEVVDHRLGDAGASRDRLHGDPAVSLLGDQVQGGIEKLLAALGRGHPRRVGPLAPARSLCSRTRHVHSAAYPRRGRHPMAKL